MDAMIALQAVSVRFGHDPQARAAVDQVSLSVRKGAAFGIVGESGSGKTTVLRVIAGVQAPSAGEVRIDGVRLGSHRDLTHRRMVQMVFQDPYGSLHPRHDVDTILREPLAIHRLDRPDERIREAMAAVGLDAGLRHRFPNQLSGGQRQRVALARALILEPRMLLLDEPTSALDVSVQAGILNLLNDLRRSRELTMILVSHDLGVVANLCDDVAVMRDGRLVDAASVAQLASRANLHEYTVDLIRASLGEGLRSEPAKQREES
jgi:peptide/nickel transport system ATP-binding protein